VAYAGSTRTNASGSGRQLCPRSRCRPIALRRLQYVLHVLEDETLMIYGQRRTRIPDRRNHRGWDYATHWHPIH